MDQVTLDERGLLCPADFCGELLPHLVGTPTLHEFCRLFTTAEPRNWQQVLETSIASHGVQVPVVTLDGYLLDGRNRWSIAESLEIPLRVVPYEQTEQGRAGMPPLVYCRAMNAARRHYASDELALIVAQAVVAERKAAGWHARAITRAARENALPVRSLSRAVAVAAKAPDLSAAVAAGGLSLAQAEQAIALPLVARQELAEQAKALASAAGAPGPQKPQKPPSAAALRRQAKAAEPSKAEKASGDDYQAAPVEVRAVLEIVPPRIEQMAAALTREAKAWDDLGQELAARGAGAIIAQLGGVTRAAKTIRELAKTIREQCPDRVCPDCHGKGCALCVQMGWLRRDAAAVLKRA